MIETDENPPANLDTSLRRRISIALSVLITVIICLTIVVGMEAEPSASGVSGGAAPAGLLFLRNPAQAAELWLADPEGAQARLLVPAVSDYSSSPDGTRIIYATQTGNEPSRIEIYDRTTLTTQVIVQSSDFVAFSPLWSPAAGPGVIAYERRTVTADGVAAPKLWLVKEDGTDLGAVMRGGEVVAYGAKWSPDGSKLAFVDPLRSEIVLFNFSNQLRRVPFNGEFDWSPDGTKLVVSAFPSGSCMISPPRASSRCSPALAAATTCPSGRPMAAGSPLCAAPASRLRAPSGWARWPTAARVRSIQPPRRPRPRSTTPTRSGRPLAIS